jgi:hypothetical protein
MVLMDSRAIIDFLTSYIGQEGRYSLATTGTLYPLAGQGRLVDVALRDDGLLQITGEDGMLVLEPERVFAIAWDGKPGPKSGQYL